MPYLKKPTRPKGITINRKDRQKVYQQQKWKDLRQAKLIQDPLCEVCLSKGIVTPATQVHHIISPFGKKDSAYYAFDFSNLQSICEKCHGRIHSQGREGVQ